LNRDVCRANGKQETIVQKRSQAGQMNEEFIINARKNFQRRLSGCFVACIGQDNMVCVGTILGI